MLASSDGFYITVKGVGGAGNSPWFTKDPIVTAAQIITNLQSIISRQTNLSDRGGGNLGRADQRRQPHQHHSGGGHVLRHHPDAQ